MKDLEFNEYVDRVLAAWLGKSIGGVVGAYVENHKERKNMAAEALWPPTIPPNDDLDIQLVWLEVLQETGCYPTHADLIRLWQERCWYNFCEYGFFLYNVQRGIQPPWSGFWNNEFFRESEGCPIRSDIWGLIAPGNPQLAAELARMDGELDHAGFSVEAEMFYAAMTAQAFVEKDREAIIAAALAELPPGSAIAPVVDEIRQIAGEYPDFARAWQVAIRRFGNRDASKAVTNLALMMLAWFQSDDDFTRAMQACVNAGWDTDCTAATLGGILGARGGTRIIPAAWRAQLGERLVCGIEVKHKDALLTDLARETALIGVEMAQTRNQAMVIGNAPAVVVRPRPKARPEFTTDYPDGPVLYAQRTSRVHLTVRNPTKKVLEGRLFISSPEGCIVAEPERRLRIPPLTAVTVELTVTRKVPTSPLPDKNLFECRLLLDSGESLLHTFGLGGAREWLIYGPYWEMWDRRKFGEDCPYAGPGRNRHPGWAGCGGDSYLHYVNLEHEYLAESRLLQAELPEEAPLRWESGTDLLKSADFSGWFGAACYYFTRTIVVPAGEKLIFNCGRSGALKVWVDGEAAGSFADWHAWTVGDPDLIRLVGDGKPHRLVFKLVSPADECALSINFFRDEAHGEKGISYLNDQLVDLVPTIGFHL